MVVQDIPVNVAESDGSMTEPVIEVCTRRNTRLLYRRIRDL
jgi:hypothetical protein